MSVNLKQAIYSDLSVFFRCANDALFKYCCNVSKTISFFIKIIIIIQKKIYIHHTSFVIIVIRIIKKNPIHCYSYSKVISNHRFEFRSLYQVLFRNCRYHNVKETTPWTVVYIPNLISIVSNADDHPCHLDIYNYICVIIEERIIYHVYHQLPSLISG